MLKVNLLKYTLGIPEIVEPLCDQTVTDGDSVELSCRVDVKADLALTVKWYNGHNIIEHSEDYYQVIENTFTFKLHNL